MISEDDNIPICSFMDTYFGNWNAMTTKKNLRDTFQKHTEVWHNASYRKIAVNILTKIGANFLLNDRIGPRTIALAIVVLENYDGIGIELTVNYRVVATKFRDLSCTERDISGSNVRDLLKFFRKRVTCKCLKDMHLEARKYLPKLGECSKCNEVKQRALLMVCSRCRIEQYCSRECQIADLPKHRSYCNLSLLTNTRRVRGGFQNITSTDIYF